MRSPGTAEAAIKESCRLIASSTPTETITRDVDARRMKTAFYTRTVKKKVFS